MNLIRFHWVNNKLEQDVVFACGQICVADIHGHRLVNADLRLVHNVRENKLLSRGDDGK